MPLPLESCALRRWLNWSALALVLGVAYLPAQDKPATAPVAMNVGQLNENGASADAVFDGAAKRALTAMKQLAEELHVTGVAVVASAPGETVTAWSSRMLVVGKMTSLPSGNAKGDNLLGIAYAKAAEMAATLKDSGSGVRPPFTGEFGWQGGVVARGRTGWLIVAFSGGRSEDDVKISQTGLKVLATAL